MMVIYQDSIFKSCLNEFKPSLSEHQLNGILNYIPNDATAIEGIFLAKYGDRVKVEPVHQVGAEPVAQLPEAGGYAVNDKIALWCSLYMDHHKDKDGNAIKYKTGPAEAGKLKALAITPDEFEIMLQVYFKSDEWYLKPKSISNFIKKFNEIRALAYAKPKAKEYPLPYDIDCFNRLDFMEKKAYQTYLREHGYVFELNPGRGGKWVKHEFKTTI